MDYEKSINISYNGILPDLFREGQGVVIRGHLEKDFFVAEEVLAKHDETYMPPEVQESLGINEDRKSKIMESIKKLDKKAKFRFWGGEKMKGIGGEIVKHINQLFFILNDCR